MIKDNCGNCGLENESVRRLLIPSVDKMTDSLGLFHLTSIDVLIMCQELGLQW